MAWPSNVTDSFFSLLKGGDWIARVLFLHYAVALHLLSTRWFVQFSGKRLLLCFLCHVEENPPSWAADAIDWAKRSIELDECIGG